MDLEDLNYYRRIRKCNYFSAETKLLKPKIQQYIEGEKDVIIRSALELRFLKGYSWLDVSMELGGLQNEQAIKKMCYRKIKERALKQQREFHCKSVKTADEVITDTDLLKDMPKSHIDEFIDKTTLK